METLSLLALPACCTRSVTKLILIGAAVVNLLPGAACALGRPAMPDLANRVVAAPAITQLASNCILNPWPPSCNSSLVFTRSEFVVAAQRLFGWSKPRNAFFFADVPLESPIYSAVQAAAPFMDGRVLCPGCLLSRNFSPDTPISRAELAVALVRGLIAVKQSAAPEPNRGRQRPRALSRC
jgi:hypothetical protein